LTIAEIANNVHLHETTVGRAVASKNVGTSHGVFELRKFFQIGFKTTSGDTGLTSAAISRALTQVIAQEDTRRPFSDAELCAKLQEQGIQIARRTIAKYRDALNILPAKNREWNPDKKPEGRTGK
jgi:RNA polymerase sigma-54 factor